jgi:hypothetical protein
MAGVFLNYNIRRHVLKTLFYFSNCPEFGKNKIVLKTMYSLYYHIRILHPWGKFWPSLVIVISLILNDKLYNNNSLDAFCTKRKINHLHHRDSTTMITWVMVMYIMGEKLGVQPPSVRNPGKLLNTFL